MTMFHDVMSANILTLTLRQMCSLLETNRHFALDILCICVVVPMMINEYAINIDP